jgi:putative DNA primase/helicase
MMFDGAGWTGHRKTRDVLPEVNASIDDWLSAVERAEWERIEAGDDKKRRPPGFLYKVNGRETIRRAASETAAMRIESNRAFDLDPDVLATPGGVVDLRTGTLRRATPGDMLSKRTAVAPVDEPTPRWLQFLNEATGGDPDFVSYLQRVLGYALTGNTSTHEFWIFYGPGGNGKGVLLSTFQHILGSYSTVADVKIFCERAYQPHKQELASLAGFRSVVAAEPDTGAYFEGELMKTWTSFEAQEGNFMRQNGFLFTPGKLILHGNHLPAVRKADNAWKRRMRIVPFMHTPASPDYALTDNLKAEASGILHWLIQGAVAFYRQGVGTCAAVTQASARYFGEHDHLGEWLTHECEKVPVTVAVKLARLKDSFDAWCDSRETRRWKGPEFKRELEKLGYRIERCKVRNVVDNENAIFGLNLKPAPGRAEAAE